MMLNDDLIEKLLLIENLKIIGPFIYHRKGKDYDKVKQNK